MIGADSVHRALVAAERIGTGALRLAAAAEAREAREAEEQRPRDVCGWWLRPADVVSVRQTLHDYKQVVEVRFRDRGNVLLIYRATNHGRFTEEWDETLDRVLRPLGWARVTPAAQE